MKKLEEWKSIKGYAGLYEISNLGAVRSITRYLPEKRGRLVRHVGTILKQTPNSRGYLRVMLSDKNGQRRYHFVHRLVAAAFGCPGTGNVVNHKDFNPANNCADNLEYTTAYGNYAYSATRGRFVRTEIWKKHLKITLDSKFGKPIIGKNIKSGEEIYFSALNDCKGAGFQPSCVCNCCKGKRRTHKGYLWRYDERTDQSNEHTTKRQKTGI